MRKGWLRSSFFCTFAPANKNHMSLIKSMESTGARLFRYRGQIPVLIFIAAVPALFLAPFDTMFHIDAYPASAFCVCAAALSAALILMGLALRAYTVCTTPKGTSGRNTAKQVADSLNTTGIYSVVRHPLYLANYLIWAGILVLTMNPFAFVIVSLAYWIYYERIMMAEENFLRGKYGSDFEEWAQRVPAFIPKPSLYKKGMLDFSLKTLIRREYATVMSAVVACLAVDYLNRIVFSLHHEDFTLGISTPMLWITAAYAVIALVVKFLKHKTSLLNADSNRD